MSSTQYSSTYIAQIIFGDLLETWPIIALRVRDIFISPELASIISNYFIERYKNDSFYTSCWNGWLPPGLLKAFRLFLLVTNAFFTFSCLL